MKWMYRKLASRFDRDHAGQSIVLLAIAFIALVAFVGLVTDISVLFVRYSSLRRTIDAAAIAGAGQIREGTDYGTVALTAREFIRLHGLEPHRVWVDTCETDINLWRAGKGPWEGDPHPEAAYPDVKEMGNTEMCNWQEPRKLVRVTAQIKSPTFFLKIIGIDDITLEASSVSETAVLDIALVLDTSQSMAITTDPVLHYQTIGYNLSGVGGAMQFRDGCYDDSTTNPAPPNSGLRISNRYYRWGPCCGDPGNGKIYQHPNGSWWIYTDTNANGVYDSGVDVLGVTNTNADGDYTDLVCHPFREVKDAARNFVKRLDYVRGDRVALVTFDRSARIIPPEGKPEGTEELMMTSEDLALATLNKYVRVNLNNTLEDGVSVWNDAYYDACYQLLTAQSDWYGLPTGTNAVFAIDDDGNPDGNLPDDTEGALNRHLWRYQAYESIAPCPDTNVGGGIRKANDALTNVATIRRDAVWVMIVLTDGAANKTDPVDEVPVDSYGGSGFCPWSTFCYTGANGINGQNHGAECPAGSRGPFTVPYCQDGIADSRHFCLKWSTDPEENGRPDWSNPDCGPLGRYDADDFARDWADFAGLIDVAPNIPGNFIAIFTIGFGGENGGILDPNNATGAPLLRYLADAGDNGVIDNDVQRDWRDNGQQDYSADAGDVDPCEVGAALTDPSAWCGQYYYARDLQSLEAVFEAIASRLFTRLSR